MGSKPHIEERSGKGLTPLSGSRRPTTGRGKAESVLVLGGGLAGLSASLRLLQHGLRVTLVEKRPFLGGRAFSFRDHETGEEVDNGQHVFTGCCTYYVDFLKAVGVLDRVYFQPRLRVEVVRNGRAGVLASTPWLGRFHLLPSFLRYPHVGLRDKLLALYGLTKAGLADRSKHGAALDAESCYDWLKRHHQTERTIDNLWELIVLPALNDSVRDTSADMALMIFQEGLLSKPEDAALGYPTVGLTPLNGEPSQRCIEKAGGELALGRSVRAIRVEDGGVTGVELSGGRAAKADAYVSALPFGALLDVLPPEVSGSPFFEPASRLTSSPIVDIHLWYDRPVMDSPLAAFLDSPVQFVFNKSLIQGSNGRGQYLCISLSGAWSYIDRPKDDLVEEFGAEMARLLPKAREAALERSLVVKETRATFRSAPGAGKCRLPQATPLPNLFLAGEWTDTGWPSTMEGAVRSGVFAADALASGSR